MTYQDRIVRDLAICGGQPVVKVTHDVPPRRRGSECGLFTTTVDVKAVSPNALAWLRWWDSLSQRSAELLDERDGQRQSRFIGGAASNPKLLPPQDAATAEHLRQKRELLYHIRQGKRLVLRHGEERTAHGG
jgi:hypothetical protein